MEDQLGKWSSVTVVKSPLNHSFQTHSFQTHSFETLDECMHVDLMKTKLSIN